MGDVITELDGKKVSDAGQLQMEVGEKSPGTKITLQVLRDGKNVSVPLTLEEMGGDRSEKLSADNILGTNRAGDWGSVTSLPTCANNCGRRMTSTVL